MAEGDEDFAFAIEAVTDADEAEEGAALRAHYARLGGRPREVCRHWLRGLCKKGASRCLWLHAYEMDLMPYCQFFASEGACLRDDCPFRHFRTETVPECAAYEAGFCPKGPRCRFLHVRRRACRSHMLFGACDAPTSEGCRLAHPPPPHRRRRQAQLDIIPRSALPSAAEYATSGFGGESDWK